MKNYRWGILGPGKIARKFASALPFAGNAILGAVASRDAAKARNFALEFGAARWYDSYERLAKDPAIDVIYIATPHAFHKDHAIVCLEHGKAVLCEKPMALDERQVRAMIDAAKANKTFLMEAMWTRFFPVVESMLELIKDGHIGTIRYVLADFGFRAPFHPESRLFDLKQGGGSLLDVGVYPLFLALLLLGEPDGIKAMGQLSVTGADESCQAILQYANGATALVSSAITYQTSISAEIAGTEGRIELAAPWYKTNTLTLYTSGKEPQTITLDPLVSGFEYEIREVTQCLEGGLTESPRMPHAFSQMLAKVMDKIRAQVGIRYTEV